MRSLLANRYMRGAGVILAAIAALWGSHHLGHRQGVTDTRTAALLANISTEQEMQYERDRADANYRGAVLAREAAQKDSAAVRGRLDGVFQELRLAKAAGASSGSDATGPDWIGIFGACCTEYGDLGEDAARLADQVNGLQGYVRAMRD